MIPLRRIAFCLLALPLWLEPATATDNAELERIVSSGALADQPNSVLLQFLRHEGQEALDGELRTQAVTQILAALRERTLVDPLEQIGTLMQGSMAGYTEAFKQQFKPSTMLRQVLGAGGGGGGYAAHQQTQQSAVSTLIDPWIRGLEAASILTLAGEEEAAAEFYRGCLTSIGSAMPIGGRSEWLQDRCIEGALEMGPEAAGALFADIYDNPHLDLGIDLSAFAAQGGGMQPMPQIQAVAAKALGMLVGTKTLGEAQRRGVIAAIIAMAEGKKQNPTVLEGAIEGLSFANDQSAIEPLQRLWKKGKPKEIRPLALRGLVSGYRHPEAVRALQDDLDTGKGLGRALRKAKAAAPWTQENPAKQAEDKDNAEERYRAAQALILADDEAGYRWAHSYLDKRNVSQGEIDRRPAVVRDLVEVGTEQARAVLAARVAEGHQNEWLEAWMRIGLFELGDVSQVEHLQALLDTEHWDFGRGSVARWYKRLKPLVWEALKMAAGVPPDRERLQRMVTDFAFAERDRISARRDERSLETARFRWQLADALAGFDDPRALPLIEQLLADEDTAVRLGAARALLGQTGSGTPALTARAMELDYGSEADVSRNPEVRSALLRHLVVEFGGSSEARQAVLIARRADSPSLRFFGLAADGLLSATVEAAGS